MKGEAVLKFRLWELILISMGAFALIFGIYGIVERTWLVDVEIRGIYLLHIALGIGSSFILAGVVAWYLLRQRGLALLPPSPLDTSLKPLDPNERLRQHAVWFVNLRWVATVAALTLVFMAGPIARILPQEETFASLLTCVSLLACSNLFFAFWSRQAKNLYRVVVCQIVSDLIILTALLHFSGGMENPLFILYILHVILSGILLTKQASYTLTLVTCGLVSFLALGELFGLLSHYTLLVFPHLAMVGHAAYDPLYVSGRLVPFIGILLLTAYFTTLIMDGLRKGEKRLVEMVSVAAAERYKLKSVVDGVGAGMILLDRDLKIQWSNPKIQEWFGWEGNLAGQTCRLVNVGRETPCADCPGVQTVQTGKVREAEFAISGRDGRKRFCHVTSSPVRDDQDNITQVVELVQDITARKALEAEMLHAGKMAALGRMAAGIAHEIGNPLSSLSLRLRLMELRRDEAFVAESLRLLQAQIERISRIVHGVSQFARQPREGWTLCQLNDILQEVLNVVQLDRRAKRSRIELSLAEDLPETVGTRDRLAQVFLNIALNAVEAMEQGGVLKVETSLQNGEIHVAFSDTGPGLSEEARANLFSQFFTTKEKGTGLGLSISYSIIHAHGGRIEVESEVKRGTTFTIIFPVRYQEADVETIPKFPSPLMDFHFP